MELVDAALAAFDICKSVLLGMALDGLPFTIWTTLPTARIVLAILAVLVPICCLTNCTLFVARCKALSMCRASEFSDLYDAR